MNGLTEVVMPRTKFVLGDLLWTKIGNHPFWPCMVTYDPVEGCFFKERKVRGMTAFIYHVQYFGETVQRGWTVPSKTFLFEGEASLHAKKEEAKRKIKHLSVSAQKKVEAIYSVSTGSMKAWLIAMREAEVALSVDLKERFETFVFKYEYNCKKTTHMTGLAPVKRNGECSSEDKENAIKPKKAKHSPGKNSDELCKICEKPNVDVTCAGDCMHYFHMECLGMIKVPQGFKCLECEAGTHSCFLCKKSGNSLIKCAHSKCSKYYHKDCIQNFECSNKEKNICPFHTCLTCYRENPKNVMSHKGPFVRCFRCPTSFHSRESCIAAGSVELTSSTIICPNHFLGKSKVSPQCTCNVPYCSACSLGGKLICCEACPNSYHAECLKSDIPEGDFLCEECLSRKHLCYGMVIWGKTGSFRWWPAKIVHPNYLPINIKNIVHYNGEFPIQYYGTNEYFWTHKGRVIPYEEHHKEYNNKALIKSSKVAMQYKKSLEEASDAYDRYLQLRLTESSLDEKPEAYKHIKVNKAVPPARIKNFHSNQSDHVCICDPSKENPCGYDSSCLNRELQVECHPDTCKAKSLCQNQKFQKREYVMMKLMKTRDRGWGLSARQYIKKGEFVIEYVGEIITHEEYQRRSIESQEKNIKNYYFLYLDGCRIIDAGPRGNWSRFINHSCEPNCELKKWHVNGDLRIGIFALVDIQPGEELSFDYQSYNYQFNQKCNCGAQTCLGYIGMKQTNLKSNGMKDLSTPKITSLKKKKMDFREIKEENHCFTCKKTGSLMVYDAQYCPRTYHINCFNMKSVAAVASWE